MQIKMDAKFDREGNVWVRRPGIPLETPWMRAPGVPVRYVTRDGWHLLPSASIAQPYEVDRKACRFQKVNDNQGVFTNARIYESCDDLSREIASI